MPSAPLKHVAGSTVTTVVDPRFGTGDTPTQPSGWGGGGSGPAPLTGDTYTAPGLYVPSGALDVWRAARASTATELVEVAVFGDSTTYGAADPGRGAGYFSWIKATKDAATADGQPDGGHGHYHQMDPLVGYTFSTDAPTVTAVTGNWNQTSYATHYSFCNRSGVPDEAITITGNGTRVRLTLMKSSAHGRVGYRVDGGAETIVDCYFDPSGKRVPYEPHPVYISGLTNGPHAITVRYVGASPSSGTATNAEFNIEFVRNNGLVFHRNATSGASMLRFFRTDLNDAGSESMTPFWMGLGSLNSLTANTNFMDGAPLGSKPAYRNVKLAVMQMGTNDFQAATITDHNTLAAYIENMAYFCRTVRSVGCSGLIITPPWSQMANTTAVQQTGGRVKAAMASLATTYNVAWADFQEPLGYDLRNWLARNDATPGAGKSHLSDTAYVIEGTWLWDNLLAL